MPRFGCGWKVKLATLLALAACYVHAGLANESLSLDATAASRQFGEAKSAVTSYDLSPTSALRPGSVAATTQRRLSRLDIAPPPGFQSTLPPESAPPSFDLSEPVAASTEADAPTGAPAPLELVFPPVEVLAAPTPTEVLAGEIHAALDRFVGVTTPHRPIGAADWNAARKAITSVYAERGYAPIWRDGGHWSGTAKSAMSRLGRAGEDGLDLAATPIAPVASIDPTPQAEAQADIQLSAAVVAYALQASGARVHPRALSKDVTAASDVAEPGAALRTVASASDPDTVLAAFNPPQEGYRALRAEFDALRAQAPAPAASFAPGPVLKLGMSDPRVPLIRTRFGLGGRDSPETSDVYDIRVASAVAAFQRVHGLPANGALTEATATALAAGGNGSNRREQLLLANMEMWRWEPREMGATRVDVNIPDFSLTLVKNDSVVQRTRVIVGKPDTPTPIFSNAIKYMLFNPAWRVPDSIIKKEMAPKYANDPNYFARHGYKVSYVGDRLEVIQPPGEANALGRMLFLFPNEHAVYLHDTPQRSLFSSPHRALSHGCVRVEDPARLAVGLMGGARRGWTEARVASLIGDKERTVALPSPIPVHLQYFTEFVDENGTLREREDLYGLTAQVASALALLRRD
jgi:L,D-transpeptidase YcbB